MVTKAKSKRALAAQPDPAPVKPELMPLYGDGGWREANRHLFPSDWSLRWFVRQNRDDLLLSGAVIELGGRLFADVAHFERLVREIGARTLQERMARDPAQVNSGRRAAA